MGQGKLHVFVSLTTLMCRPKFQLCWGSFVEVKLLSSGSSNVCSYLHRPRDYSQHQQPVTLLRRYTLELGRNATPITLCFGHSGNRSEGTFKNGWKIKLQVLGVSFSSTNSHGENREHESSLKTSLNVTWFNDPAPALTCGHYLVKERVEKWESKRGTSWQVPL